MQTTRIRIAQKKDRLSPAKNTSATMSHNWLRHAPFIVAFDYNPHPLNADRFGDQVDWKEMRNYLRKVKPDLVLVQTLGYWGWAAFRSKIAPAPSRMKFGYVETFRKICDQEKVRMGMYVESFQTVGNSRPFSELERKRWFRTDADGNKDYFIYCPNSPFADEYLIPFCLETIARFRPAAFWFDHSRTRPCFCAFCKDKFRRKYGQALCRPENANQRAQNEIFSEETFVEAMNHVTEAIHMKAPGAAVCWPNAIDIHTVRSVFPGNNWASSDEVNIPDLRTAQFDCTFRSTLGIPAHLWVPDLARSQYPRARPQALLYAEASTILAHGCGMAMYHIPTPLGATGADKMIVARKTANFMRRRAAVCLGNESIPHVAIVASRAHNLRYPDRFQPILNDLQGMHEILSQNHIPCEVVNDDVLRSRLTRYALVVLGEVYLLAPDTARALEDYVHKGGRILIIGNAPAVAEPTAVSPGIPWLFDLSCRIGDRVIRHFDGQCVTHVGQMVYPTGHPMQTIWNLQDVHGQEQEPLFVKRNIGRGTVFWLCANAITEYSGPHYNSLRMDIQRDSALSVDAIMGAINFGKRLETKAGQSPVMVPDKLAAIDYSDRPFKDPHSTDPIPHPHLRNFIGKAIRHALGNRWLIRTNAPPGVELVLNRRGADLFVHVVNHTLGTQSHPYLPDVIPTLADITFELHFTGKAANIQALPKGERIAHRKTKHGYQIVIPRLGHHTIVRFSGVLAGCEQQPDLSMGR